MDVGFVLNYYLGGVEAYFVDNGAEDEESEPDFWRVGIARVPCVLLRSVEAVLGGHHIQRGRDCESLPLAWMVAIGLRFPDTPLAALRAGVPSLLPQWLLQHFDYYHVRIHGRTSHAELSFVWLKGGPYVGLTWLHQRL
jgi:hypothetical protein